MKLLIKIVSIICISSYAYAAQTQIAEVSGMVCISCQNMVKNSIKKNCPGADIKISWKEDLAMVSFENDSNVTLDKLKEIINNTGFEVGKMISVNKIISDPKIAKKYIN